MNKLIIIEGQDNCGKTTLIKSLKKKINNPKIITLASTGPPFGCNIEEWNKNHYQYTFNAMEMLLNNGFDIIMDRFHIGETCYGPIFRNTDSDFIWNIEKEFLIKNQEKTNLIIITDDSHSIINRDDGLSLEKNHIEYDLIKSKFKTAFELSRIKNKLYFDIDKTGWVDPNIIYNWIYNG